MKSRLPLVLFLFSILMGFGVLLAPWETIVGQGNPPRVWFEKGYIPQPIEGADQVTMAWFWQTGPYYTTYNLGDCPMYTNFYDSAAVQNSYENYQNAGRIIFGSLIVCWAVFGFLHRWPPVRFSLPRLPLLGWMIISVTILSFIGLVIFSLSGSQAGGCYTNVMPYVRAVTLNWPTVIISLLGLGLGVGAILTSIHSTRKIPG
jgi:hypothetical protein